MAPKNLKKFLVVSLSDIYHPSKFHENGSRSTEKSIFFWKHKFLNGSKNSNSAPKIFENFFGDTYLKYLPPFQISSQLDVRATRYDFFSWKTHFLRLWVIGVTYEHEFFRNLIFFHDKTVYQIWAKSDKIFSFLPGAK